MVQAQIKWEFGPYVKANWATQTYDNPASTSQGTFAFGRFLTFGAGIFGDYYLNDKHSIEGRLGYMRKGNLDEGNQVINGPGPLPASGDFKNTFDYLNLDLVYFYHVWNKPIQPIIGAGLQNAVLIHHMLGSDIEPYNLYYPFDRFEPISNYNLSYLLALGVQKKDAFSIIFEFNRDILPIIKGESLRVKNILFSLQLNVTLGAG